MKAALLALVVVVACGKREDKTEPPVAVETTRESCKAGATSCDGDAVVMCETDGNRRKVTSCRGGCKQGACVDTCGANDVELIYVVDTARALHAFDPRKLPGEPFRKIGALSCSQSTPNSMAVDRTGIAWVAYHNGFLHQVSLLDAHCFSQASQPEGAPLTFGMGFVTDGPKATTEKLYVVENAGTQLATIDTASHPARWVPRGKVTTNGNRNPELTGTSDGRLYGYFPGQDTRGYIQEIDRETGSPLGRRWGLPAGTGYIGAWAFAFWGGVFYVFVTFGGANEVHAINRRTGAHELVIARSEYEVVGAGVSTCAPLLEKPP